MTRVIHDKFTRVLAKFVLIFRAVHAANTSESIFHTTRLQLLDFNAMRNKLRSYLCETVSVLDYLKLQQTANGEVGYTSFLTFKCKIMRSFQINGKMME